MRPLQDETGKRKIVFLSQDDKDALIYMNSDIWITPELKRFKNDLLEKMQVRGLNTDSCTEDKDYGIKGNLLG